MRIDREREGEGEQGGGCNRFSSRQNVNDAIIAAIKWSNNKQTNNRTKFPGCEKGKAHTAGPNPSVNRPYLAPRTLCPTLHPLTSSPFSSSSSLPQWLQLSVANRSRFPLTSPSYTPSLISFQPIPFLSLLFFLWICLWAMVFNFLFDLFLRLPQLLLLSPLLRFSHFPLSNDAAVSVFGFGRHRHRVTFAVFRLHLLQLPRPFPPRPAWLVVCCLIVCPEDIKSIAARQGGREAGGGSKTDPPQKVCYAYLILWFLLRLIRNGHKRSNSKTIPFKKKKGQKDVKRVLCDFNIP